MSRSYESVKSTSKQKFFWVCALIFAFMVFLRIITLGTSPLFDPTDSRYANIAQQMILRQDWITPYIPAYHQPFLGKPPLSFWLVASSYVAFGCNELTSRLPNFIEGMLILLFTFLISKKLFDKRTAYLAPLILFSTLLFFIESATVAMDTGVCLMVTAGIWAYLETVQAKEQNHKGRQLLSEVSLGILFGFGLLTKGPIALLLFLGPIGLYSLFKKSFSPVFAVRWWLVFPIGIALALPWYLAAQQANPDFFDYFFVHEHFLRYIKSDYGDRYGSGHHQFWGMSWIFLLAAFMPWSFFILPVLNSLKKQYVEAKQNNKPKFSNAILFILSWVAFAPLFFTVAKSVLITYVLTSLPPLAILYARFLSLALYESKKSGYAKKPSQFFFFDVMSCVTFIASVVIAAGFGMLVYTSVLMKPLPVVALFVGALLLVIVSGYVFSLSQKRSSNNLKKLILLTSTSFVVLIACWFGLLSDTLAQTKSMKAVLGNLEHKIPDYPYRTVYLWQEPTPYSWYFYSETAKVNEMISQHSNKPYYFPTLDIRKNLVNTDQSLIILTEPFLPKFKKRYPLLITKHLVAHAGKYYIVEN